MPKFDIDADTWSALNSLLDRALDLAPAERIPWIDALGPEYDALKPRLRDLISRGAALRTSQILGTIPRFPDLPDEGWTALRRSAGDIVGPYRLIRELGEGGMGTVWLAERNDGLIPRPVALKLPRRLVAKSRAGRAHGAGARNPGHAQPSEHRAAVRRGDQPPKDSHTSRSNTSKAAASTSSSRAPGSMCGRAAGALPASHRCGGVRACPARRASRSQAVQHPGHRRRRRCGCSISASPSCSSRAKPRETELTEQSGRALTPDYASPEQIAGAPIGTASDVYSLGVVLYELLTRVRPYRLKRDSRGALEEAILQSDPAKPSDAARERSMRKALRGDLDWIVLKAMAKERDRRYASAADLGADLRRFLRDEPVEASPPSAAYRISKFVRRHRVGVTAGALAGPGADGRNGGHDCWHGARAARRGLRAHRGRHCRTLLQVSRRHVRDRGAGRVQRP